MPLIDGGAQVTAHGGTAERTYVGGLLASGNPSPNPAPGGTLSNGGGGGGGGYGRIVVPPPGT